MEYSKIFQTAQQYVEAGLSVLPLAVDGRKRPASQLLPFRSENGKPAWTPLMERLPTSDELKTMFPPGTSAGIGIIGGAVSGNLAVLDFECGEVYRQFARLVEEQSPGLLAKLPRVVTPREARGRHVYFRAPSALPCERLALSEAGELWIEIKGAGGYVAAPGGNPGVHPTGRPYKHVRSTPPLTAIPTLTSEEVAALIDTARSLNKFIPETTDDGQQQSLKDPDSPGNLYARSTTFAEAGLLEKHGWTQLGEYGEDQFAWARPGKDTPGFSALSGKSDRYGRDVLRVFSSNADPLSCSFSDVEGHHHSTGRPYTLFAAFAALECKGDFSRAALKLSRRGYTLEHQQHRSELLESFRPWIPFPVELLPEPCRAFVAATAAAQGADCAMIAVPLLSALAGAIGYRRVQRFEGRLDWRQPCTIWTLTIAPTGVGKTHGWSEAVRYLTEMEKKAYRRWKEQMEVYQRDLARFKAARKTKGGGQQDEPVKPIRERYRLQDCTLEKLVSILEHKPEGLLLAWGEMSSWLGSFDRYRGGGSDEGKWLEMWDGGFFSDDRVSEERLATQASVSITGTIQPGTFRRLITQSRYESGMVQRFLLCKPPATCSKFQESGISPKLDQRMRSLFKRLTSLQLTADGEPQPVYFSEDAAAMFKTWQHAGADAMDALDEEDLLRGFHSKAVLYCCRLSLLLHLVKQVGNQESDDRISVDTLLEAIQLVDWFKHETARVYALLAAGGEEDTDDSLVFLITDWASRYPDWFTVREIRKSGPFRIRNATPEQVEKAIRAAAAKGWLDSRERKPKRGPTSEQFRFKKGSDDCQVLHFSREKQTWKPAARGDVNGHDSQKDIIDEEEPLRL